MQTKPLFVLATQHPGSETGLTFTLRTRVQGRQAEDEVSKVSKDKPLAFKELKLIDCICYKTNLLTSSMMKCLLFKKLCKCNE